MAAIGLLMLLTNLLTCSKCLVISVAKTMSIIACRSVRNWFLSAGMWIKLLLTLTHTVTHSITPWRQSMLRLCTQHHHKPQTTTTDLSVFLKMLLLLSRTVSWKASAAWWLSSTAVSLYRIASSLPALHRKELVLPGWSTSCTVAAISAATSSSWSRLPWKNNRDVDVRAGLHRRHWPELLSLNKHIINISICNVNYPKHTSTLSSCLFTSRLKWPNSDFSSHMAQFRYVWWTCKQGKSTWNWILILGLGSGLNHAWKYIWNDLDICVCDLSGQIRHSMSVELHVTENVTILHFNEGNACAKDYDLYWKQTKVGYWFVYFGLAIDSFSSFSGG